MTVCSAFFYGTLLHPKILKRVIGNDGDHLSVCPAVLLEHTRHHIRGEDYPGILPYATSRELFDHDLTGEERSVRGTLVTGLTTADMDLLDEFEADEYNRELVPVHPLGEFRPLEATISEAGQALSRQTEVDVTVPTHIESLDTRCLAPPITAHTYIWAAPTSLLVPELWSYKQFLRDNAWKWTGELEEGKPTNEETGVVVQVHVQVKDELAGDAARTGGSHHFTEVEKRKERFSASAGNGERMADYTADKLCGRVY